MFFIFVLGQMKLLDLGLVSQALELESFNSKISGSPAEVEQSLIELIQGYIVSAGEGGASNIDNAHLNYEKSRNLTEVKRRILSSFFSGFSKTKCPHCEAPFRKVRQEHQTKVMLRAMSVKQAGQWVAAANRVRQRTSETGRDDGDKFLYSDRNLTAQFCSEQQFFSPLEAKEHIEIIYDNDPLLMRALFSCLRVGDGSPFERGGGGERGVADMFFLEMLLVCPSRFRPVSIRIA